MRGRRSHLDRFTASAPMIRVLEVLVLVDLAALTLIGAAILLASAGWHWLIGT